MRDGNIEHRLRAGLQAAGDELPLTITAAELERRLAARRRAASGRRLSLVAAAVAVVAVGSMVAATNGWLRLPAIGVVAAPTATPSSAPSAPPTPTVRPSPSAEPTPRIRESVALGTPNEAILVRPIGANIARPDTFQVTRVDPLASTSTVIGVIPGSVLPADAELAWTRPPMVSETGWLTLPINRTVDGDTSIPGLVVVDLTDISLPAAVFDHVDSATWDEVDELILADGRSISFGVPGTGQVIPSEGHTNDADIVHAPHLGGPLTSVTEGSRFIATAVSGDKTVWGAVGFDGVFRATNDLPAIYQRSGIERPAGAGAHTLTMACDQSGALVTNSCNLIEQDATGKSIRSWLAGDGVAGLFDMTWATDGKGVWLLLDGGASGGQHAPVLTFASSPGTGEARSVDLPSIGGLPTILGIASEDSPGRADVVAIGDDSGFIHAFVAADGSVQRQDGTAWFAGWAGRQAPYDPD